jgi:hypothetical protein
MAIGMAVAVGGRGVAVGGKGVCDGKTTGKFGAPPEQAVRASNMKINARFSVTIATIIPETASLLSHACIVDKQDLNICA